MTLAVDAHSRRCLAVWLSFDRPSYRTLLATIRLLVRRWARLPDQLVVDGGAEFHGTYLESLAGLYEMRIRHRPKGAARHGSVIERLTGTTEQEVIKQLEGNTKATRNVRTLTPEVDPRNHATWDLATLYELLCWFLYEAYDQRPHPTLDASPRAAFVDRMRTAGQRPYRLVAYDETFLLATMPQGSRPTAAVDPARGIKAGYLHYWAPELSAPRLNGTRVPYRSDPWDIRAVHVYVGNRWVKAATRYGALDERISERELLIASQEHRIRRRATASARRNFERDLIASLNRQPQGKRESQRAADVAASDVREIAGLQAPDPMPEGLEGTSAGVRPERRSAAKGTTARREPSARRPQDEIDRWYRSGEMFEDYS